MSFTPRRHPRAGRSLRPSRRATLLAVALLAVAALAGGSVSGPAAAARSECKRAHSKTIARNRTARVYETTTSEGSRLYACAYATGRRLLLAEASDDDYVSSQSYELVGLRGRFVALTTESTDVSCKAACPPGYSGSSSRIEVFDSRRRREVRSIAAQAQKVVLTTRGAVAWSELEGKGIAIRAADGAGSRVLDSGAIAADALRVELTIVSWVKDGVERFARLR